MEGKKTKDKTRVLAHSRRQRENDTFTGIAEALPIQENTKDLDKASVLRVAIHFLKLRDVITEGEEEQSITDGLSARSPLPNFSKDILQALDGFLLVVSSDGRILYVSESIANYLGLRQVDVIGVHVQDIIHPQDCSEVSAIFQTQGNDVDQVFDPSNPLKRKFILRMRCAFTPSVRSITRCSNFKPVYCSASLKFAKSGPKRGQFLGIVALCKLASIPKIKEMCVGTSFKTKHSLDLSYQNIDTRIRWILGYDPSEMMGLKAYQYFHPEDLSATTCCHMNLLSRGRSFSPCYRFMSRWGDWVWVRSKSYMLYNPISHLPEGIAIYTWIVRVDEEDERMLAIKEGKPGEHLARKYEPYESTIKIAEAGSVDLTSLVDPTTPGKRRKQSSETDDSTPSNSPPSHVQPEQATTNVVLPPVQPVQPVRQVSLSPERHLPQQPVPISQPGLASSIQPLTIPVSITTAIPAHPPMVTSPPLSMSPPDSTMGEFPPNVNPFVTQGSPKVDHGSPNCRSVIRGPEVTDLIDSHSAQQSFIPSPPYTPYHSPTKHISFDHTTGSLYVNTYPTPYSSGQPSPVERFQRSLSPSETSGDGQYGSPSAHLSPPYSNVTVGSPYQEDEMCIVSEATQFTTPCPCDIKTPTSTTLQAVRPPADPNTTGYQNVKIELPSAPSAIGQSSLPVRQTVIESTYVNKARMRYSTVANGVPTGHMSQIRNDREETESISQWSQWLKGGAPAPVC